jgi:hypothetical protein
MAASARLSQWHIPHDTGTTQKNNPLDVSPAFNLEHLEAIGDERSWSMGILAIGAWRQGGGAAGNWGWLGFTVSP